MNPTDSVTEMAGNIIPAIATTNAMTASLCVLQAFKVLRSQLNKAKMVFLTRGTERVISSESLRPPNPHCATCSVTYVTLAVDTKRAKLGDLVDTLKSRLNYGEDFSIKRDADLLYDVDEDIHLDKKFQELGLKADSFVTVSDEADTNAKVDVIFSLVETPFADDASPITLPETLDIPTKPKPSIPAQTNGHAPAHEAPVPTNGASKRKASAAGLEDDATRKKGKVSLSGYGDKDGVVVVEDDDEDDAGVDDGVIVFDD